MRLYRILTGAACLLLPLGLAAAPAQGVPTHEHRLSNGLRVIVKEDHRAPVVVSQVWYHAGSMDEFNGTTGVAHVLEHMMFKGTKNLAAGEFSRRIAAAGGRENAFTGKDYTAYFQQLHKSRLPLAFKLEADRMANLNFSDAEFGKEVKVVMEERRWRTEDRAQSLVYETFMSTAFQAHPYRRPIVGWMDDLENMTAKDARDWYRRWYAPNNALLVVVGDVKAQEVFRLAERYFGPIKARPLPARKPQHEPEQKGLRRVIVKAPAELPYLMMGWKVPMLRDPERDWEPYALDMLAGVLDGNDSARLNRVLVREQELATSVGAGYDAVARGPGLFILDGTPREGRSVEELEQALRQQLREIVDNGVTADELARVRAQLVAAQVYQRDSVFYQAMLIGGTEMAGISHRHLDTMLERLQQVTAEQVQEVARKYLSDDTTLTVAVLDPQPLEGRRPAALPPGGHDDVR